MIEIKNVFNKIIYQSETAKDVKTAVEEAVKKGVSLDNANLANINLKDANLKGASFRHAYLNNVNLSGANLTKANLYSANLMYANLADVNFIAANLNCACLIKANLDSARLIGADLRRADLTKANLEHADLQSVNSKFANFGCATLFNADLSGADLESADLRTANFLYANLKHADLKNVVYDESTSFFTMQCPSEGSFIGWKKAYGNLNKKPVIVKLLITKDSKRSSATTKKCRCSKATVLEIQNLDGTKDANNDYAVSECDLNFCYKVGKTVEVKDFDEDRWNECSAGIHFFIDKGDAVNY